MTEYKKIWIALIIIVVVIVGIMLCLKYMMHGESVVASDGISIEQLGNVSGNVTAGVSTLEGIKQNRTYQYLFWMVVVLLVAALIYFFYYMNKNRQNFVVKPLDVRWVRRTIKKNFEEYYAEFYHVDFSNQKNFVIVEDVQKVPDSSATSERLFIFPVRIRYNGEEKIRTVAGHLCRGKDDIIEWRYYIDNNFITAFKDIRKNEMTISSPKEMEGKRLQAWLDIDKDTFNEMSKEDKNEAFQNEIKGMIAKQSEKQDENKKPGQGEKDVD